ncbi:MAG: RimK family alpha-L-glutamate ligase [Chloroflexi bacterium]|nr:MAG: RimK family alpha-L-glutamate ligase [Chloroflexota bacterium]
MKIGILGSRGKWHVEALVKALEERGVPVDCFPITRLVARISDKPRVRVCEHVLEGYDAIIVRSIPSGSLEQIIFRVDALHRLEDLGVRVVNSARTIERTVDKYYTSALLEDAGIPTPRTVVTERFDEAMEAFRELGSDVVVKPLFGSEGRGMVRVCDEDAAYRVFRALELGRYVFYLQEFIPHANWDIRAFVIGGEVVAAMVRHADSWKTNVARGARAEPLELSEELRELSLKASAILEADYAGVDILRAEDGGYYVIEVNGIPGWKGIQSTTSVDIAGKIVEHVMELARGKNN